MKVVDEPSNYGMNWGGGGYNNNDAGNNDANKLNMRIQPSNFSGPPHLKEMLGKCYSMTDDNYKYNLCPFSNISQHEQSLRWNPYNGVLGVWQEWEIENNTFTGMMMHEGDTCGKSGFRSAKIILECGEDYSITKVSEPHTCHYEVHFHTPLVCHPHALLVYPTLSEEFRHRWDELEGRLLSERITEKGYKKYLNKIFIDAGLRLSEKQRVEHSEAAKVKDTEVAQPKVGDFDSLFTCSEEYRKLHDQVQSLKALLEKNGISQDEPEKKIENEPQLGDGLMDYEDMSRNRQYDYAYHP